MKIGSIMWASHMPALVEAAREIDGLELKLYSMRDMEDEERRAEIFAYFRQEADAIILYPSTNATWDEIAGEVAEIVRVVPAVAFGYDPGLLQYNTVPVPVALVVQNYLAYGGVANAKNALLYVLNVVLHTTYEIAPPKEVSWQGIFYPGYDRLLCNAAEYQAVCPGYQAGRPTVGILYYRNMWLNSNHEVVAALVENLNSLGLNALPVFSTGRHDVETGSRDNAFIMEEYFMRDGQLVIEALIDLQSFFLLRQGESERTAKPAGQDLLQKMDIPIVKGLLTYSKTEEEWRSDAQGIAGPTMVMSVGMPECNGIIEPIVIGCQERVPQQETGGTLERYIPVDSQVNYLCRRVKKWLDLKYKPVQERKVAIILHNNPCAGVELSVGGGANLDTLESVVRILGRMKAEGYRVYDLPASGEEMIRTIMDRKAISDFRWTPIEEIVAKGGVLQHLQTEQYRRWFDNFPPAVRQAMIETWGNPPGEEIDEVPAAMVYQGDILITGVEYGNAVVCVQPKRGCAGPRCDGRVCKILHDPECPPTHQYVATYRYLEDIWGADVIVHVGTHGNLEFLPGKSLGLSEHCYPELTLGTLPHLYIYNTDNPPEGTIAKRRSYATLIGHMQTVLVETAAYGQLDDLAALLGEYQEARSQDPARAHALEHLITEKIGEAKLSDEIDLSQDFGMILEKAHGMLNRLKNSMHQDGMHIFDDIPLGERRVEFIHSILRHDMEEQASFGRVTAEIMGLDYDALRDAPHVWHEEFGKTYGDLLQEVHVRTKSFIREFIYCG